MLAVFIQIITIIINAHIEATEGLKQKLTGIFEILESPQISSMSSSGGTQKFQEVCRQRVKGINFQCHLNFHMYNS